MSENLRIALVAEGPTDAIIIKAALQALLPEGVSFILRQIQPGTPSEEELGGSSDATSTNTGCGWGGVYRWCRNVSDMGSGDVLTAAGMNYDYIILHLDVDVSRKSYADANIRTPVGSALPCDKICPPAINSAKALQEVIQSWLAPATASNIIWCFPADNTETWGFAAWKTRKANKIKKLECHRGIAHRLNSSIKKTISSYIQNEDKFRSNWNIVEQLCPQANIFSEAIRSTILTQLEARP